MMGGKKKNADKRCHNPQQKYDDVKRAKLSDQTTHSRLKVEVSTIDN